MYLKSELIHVSMLLRTRILRHMATELNLDMRSDGYVRVQDILRLNLKTRANVPLRSHSVDEIREVSDSVSVCCRYRHCV